MRIVVAVLGVLFLGTGQEATVDSVLDAMEARAAGVKDLRATVTSVFHDVDPRTKESRDRVQGRGTLLLRGADAAWTVRSGDRDDLFAPWLDPKQGLRAALDGKGLVFHAPARLQPPEDFAGQSDPAHHGASYFVSRFETAPHLGPLLAERAGLHPVAFLYERAPKRYIAGLPNLKLSASVGKDGRNYHVLSAARSDGALPARIAESRGGEHQSWLGGEFWVDAKDFTIEKIVFRYERSVSGPVHRTDREFVFGRRGEFGKVKGLPTIVTWGGCDLILSDLQINRGVKDEELRVVVPPGRIVRDWFRRTPESYRAELEKTPDDPSTWLSLGSILIRQQDWKGAGEAFQKVVQLRPDAEEGYAALAYLLKQPSMLITATDALEKGAGRSGSALVHVALAHRYAMRDHARCAEHFEAALKIRGEDPQLLESMLITAQPADSKPLFLRAFQAELKTGEDTFIFTRWDMASRPTREREELAALYEAALQGGPQPAWVRGRLIELCVNLKRLEQSRRHARAALEELEAAGPRRGPFRINQVLDGFLAEQDFDRARRVLRLLEAPEGGKPGEFYARTEARIAAFEGAVPDLVEYWDRSIRPEWRAGEGYSWSPRANAFVWALRDAKRVVPFSEAFLDRAGPDPRQKPAVDLLEILVKEHTFGTDWARLNAQLKERSSGKPASGDDLLQVCSQYVHDGKYEEGALRIVELLQRPDLTPPQRVRGQLLNAECAEARGDRKGVLLACARVLEERGISGQARRSVLLFQARALLEGGDLPGAADASASALREAVKGKDLEGEREIVEAVRKLRGRLPLVPGADPASRAICALALRDPAKAADLLTVVCRAWPEDPFLLRELVRSTSDALRTPEALAARTSLSAVLEKLSGSRVRLPRMSEATGDVSQAVIRSGDPAGMKSLTETLVGETRWMDSYGAILSLLSEISDGPYLERTAAELVSRSKNPTERFNAIDLAARAWQSLDRTEKAAALLAGITEANGWPATLVDSARIEASRMSKEAADRKELLREWREKLAALEDAEDESEVLERLMRDSRAQRLSWMNLDFHWRAALRSEKPDPLLLKIGALRGDPAVRVACIEKLQALGQARPEWSIRWAFLIFGPGMEPRATETILAQIQAVAASPAQLRFLARLLSDNRWRLTAEQILKVGRALEAAGAYRRAWDFLKDTLVSQGAVLPYALKWVKVAEPGDERGGVRLLIARELAQEKKMGAALAEIEAAIAEVGLDAFTRRQLESLNLAFLAQIGGARELSGAVLRWLRLHDFGPVEIETASRLVGTSSDLKLDDFITEWEAASKGEKPSPGLYIFGARLHERAGHAAEARARLEAGVRFFPKEYWILRPLAAARMAAKEWGPAAEAYEVLLDGEFPPNGDLFIHLNLVTCYGRTDRPAAALEHLRVLEQGLTRSLETVIRLAEEVGLFDEAVRLCRAEMEVHPHVYLRTRLAQALRKAGRNPEAEVEFKAILDSKDGVDYYSIRQFIEVLPAEEQGGKVTPVLLEKVRKAGDLEKAVQALHLFAAVLSAEVRLDVARRWEQLVEKEAVDERMALVTQEIYLVWGRTPLKAIDHVLTALKFLPESVLLLQIAAQQLSEWSRPAEAALHFERLAALDPDGTRTKSSPGGHLRTAFWNHVRAKDLSAELRLGLDLLEGPGLEADDRAAVLRVLGSAVKSLEDELWPELRRIRFRPLAASEKEEVAKQIDLLSGDDISRRRAAALELSRLGTPAFAALIPLTESADEELRIESRRIILSMLQKQP